eukprot:TRINITY_DN9359_c0_g1_i1.p2 TRINITY_DN9359_c0_g1~~TRINITY_DN9359_c0_g1_i1.p2  ORF type:complete len:103 (-),score=26.31 TRINITY_DN9359_c0_g1_i1:37-345(-)
MRVQKPLQDKLVNWICVTTLIIDMFIVKLQNITSDLRKEPARVAQHYQSVGCKRVVVRGAPSLSNTGNQETETQEVAKEPGMQLTAPLKFPEAGIRNKRKRT